MFAVVQGGHVICEHCGGSVEAVAQIREASWASPDVWEYQCSRCGSLYFSEVNPTDVPLVPQLE